MRRWLLPLCSIICHPAIAAVGVGSHGRLVELVGLDRVVDAEGNVIGASMWPLLSEWYHDYISVCSLDAEYAQIGTEVTVLWGDAADEKKAVKATVARYPYLDLTPNYKYPVEEIPHFEG